ncbi:hypothetical protein LV89_03498 [Arcicella aurantiaca]|uniref:Uncharacterized protein n=1 Tax=Arcicella aurantiaca TaxID=591202 RepID=A0A316DZZ5_9BACT|nr:hypothetical protein LV89_03498 [Arcicella aurantiaca]
MNNLYALQTLSFFVVIFSSYTFIDIIEPQKILTKEPKEECL